MYACLVSIAIAWELTGVRDLGNSELVQMLKSKKYSSLGVVTLRFLG